MKQIKVEHKSNFTTVSNTFIRDKKISLKAKGLLLTILSLNEKEWDFSVKGLCYICKESKSAIYSAIDELLENGYCIRSQENGDGGRFLPATYTFYEEPCTENRDTVNQDTENQTQLNTNIIKKQNKKEQSFSFCENEKKEKNDTSFLADQMPIPDERLANVWNKWVAYARQQFNAKSVMLSMQYAKLVEYSNYNASLAEEIVNNAILGGYSKFLPLSCYEQETTIRRRTETEWQ